ncbi:NeuD/PglB/VioB family sugar acetyltransferase [Acinetobacter johnsonii]|uniref:NeuD/PglB/VioB family sugar acetyltransferase n=1 Tax=Acinetobacter johnsonii TaxID=40214 RepID=UPI00244D52E7|nr:NeuD/PglB/VioB family sugar acetyltransferase [Acinetobacter johnsonii]MDH0711162.1 NeuD/PglB/VioB family sugar acetyltransferase [Acinetobacter johnsonii]MDH1711826.1 NeuD/PglB/VioB family sugar acetyltransferase [Acinetobacter johnsonii]
MEKIIIYGIGDFARLMHHYFTTESDFEVSAFCVDQKYKKDNMLYGLPIISYEEIEKLYSAKKYSMFVAVGYSNMRVRKSLFDKAKSKGYKLVNFISRSSSLNSNIIFGENNVFFQNVCVEPFVVIGDNNIFWSSAVICHDATVGSHNFIAAGAIIGGFSKIEDLCFLGFRSTVIQNLTLSNETLLGANSLLLDDTSLSSLWLGSPAKLKGLHSAEGIKIK